MRDTIIREQALRAFMERAFVAEGFAAQDARTIQRGVCVIE